MGNKSSFFLGVVLAVLICFLILKTCHPGQGQEKNYYVDTVRIADTLFLPAPPVINRVLVEVPAEVDTQAALRDYFAKNIYQDTIVKTPQLSVIVRDTVDQNRLSGRQVYYTMKQPVFREKRNSLSLSSTFAFQSIPVTLDYYRDDWQFSAGYDVVNKMPVFGLGYRFARW